MQTDYLKVKPLVKKLLNEIKSALVVRVIVGHGCNSERTVYEVCVKCAKPELIGYIMKHSGKSRATHYVAVP